jgi:hypothetical protein
VGGLLVALLFVAMFFLAALAPEDRQLSAPAANSDPAQVYIEHKIAECRAQGGVERLHPTAGYLGCDLPVKH